MREWERKEYEHALATVAYQVAHGIDDGGFAVLLVGYYDRKVANMAGADGTGGEGRVPQATSATGSSSMAPAIAPPDGATVTTATDVNGPGSEARNTGGKGGRGNA